MLVLILSALVLPGLVISLILAHQYFFAKVVLVYAAPYAVTLLLMIKPIWRFAKVWRHEGSDAARAGISRWVDQMRRTRSISGGLISRIPTS